MKEVKPSIIIALFQRKGGEGKYTKIVSGSNFADNPVFSTIIDDEIGLIFYYKSDSVWFLLSDQKIRANYNGAFIEINLEDLTEVSLALQEEFKAGIQDQTDFTRLVLKHKKGNYLLHLEKGLPYKGLYQVLHFIASKS